MSITKVSQITVLLVRDRDGTAEHVTLINPKTGQFFHVAGYGESGHDPLRALCRLLLDCEPEKERTP